MNKLPLILAAILYLLILFTRYLQGGWDIKNLDLFPEIRQSLDQRISQLLPSPQAELLSGIILGNKKDLPVSLKLALRDSSTLHIVVVSGQNLTLVAGLFLSLAGLIKRKIALVFSFAAVIFYTLLTGGQIPVLRAAIMVILAFGAEAYGRQRDGIWVLAFTAGIMLLVNPNWVGDLSFQLSFLATFGIIVLAPKFEKILNFLPPFIKQDIAITTGAQLMVMPVIIQNFHQLSIVGIFANLLVGWTMPIIMILGLLMLLAGSLFAIAVNVFLTYFIYVVQFFASLPFAWEYVGEQIWLVWLGYYMLLTAVVLSLAYVEKTNS
ncbi:ComEC/Rec2 family competence protein [Patescibacteria group bacterium]|nr:ComEC/Rec2 family competence protein [Patescibacteria group bacterium]